MNIKSVTEHDDKYAGNVENISNIKIIKDYLELSLQRDTILLGDDF